MTQMREMIHQIDAGQNRGITREVVSTAARLLFANGQTTERTVLAAKRLAAGLGARANVFPSWGKLGICIENDTVSHTELLAVKPSGVDMNKVIATLKVVDQVHDHRLNGSDAKQELEKIGQFKPVPVLRFALMAGAGAAALGVIFGTTHLLSLVLIALSAGIGAFLRRGVAGISHNLYLQPFCAALFAGIVGAVAVRLQLSSSLRLIAVCPCMVLVPGPHFLNGALDLARARFKLGSARIAYASLITLAICLGLVLGLALGGVALPASAPSHSVPIGYDVLAAGVAVAAYGVFFNMPWRMLPIPILVGMLAHASRWMAISVAGASVEVGAFVACLIVGVILSPVAEWLRLPFAGVAFASVVSLIPGVFLFRTAGGLVELATSGPGARGHLFAQITTDATTALLIILAMAFGVIVPKLCFERFARP